MLTFGVTSLTTRRISCGETNTPRDLLRQFEDHGRLAEADFISSFQFGSASVPMNFAAHAVAYNPDSAFGPALVPAVIEQAVFAGDPVVLNVRMLARDRVVDFGLFDK